MRIHHIGYAVFEIEKTIVELEKIGYVRTTEIISDVNRKVNICFLKNDGYVVELVQGLSDSSPVANFLKKSGVGTYHICYISKNIEETTKKLIEYGYMLIDALSFAPAISKTARVAFFYRLDVGLIEIVCDLEPTA